LFEGEKYLNETIYDKTESQKIRRTVYSRKEKGQCVFLDDNGTEIKRLILPLDIFYDHRPLVISFDNTKVYVQLYKKPGIICYSILDGSIIWRADYKACTSLFIFRNTLFCQVGDGDEKLVILDESTGKELLSFAISYTSRLEVVRITERLFIMHVDDHYEVYDIINNTRRRLSVEHPQLKQLGGIFGVESINEKEVDLRYKYWDRKVLVTIPLAQIYGESLKPNPTYDSHYDWEYFAGEQYKKNLIGCTNEISLCIVSKTLYFMYNCEDDIIECYNPVEKRAWIPDIDVGIFKKRPLRGSATIKKDCVIVNCADYVKNKYKPVEVTLKIDDLLRTKDSKK
jgi:hypothetical protein